MTSKNDTATAVAITAAGVQGFLVGLVVYGATLLPNEQDLLDRLIAAALGDEVDVAGYSYTQGGVTGFTRKVIGAYRFGLGAPRALGGPDTKFK